MEVVKILVTLLNIVCLFSSIIMQSVYASPLQFKLSEATQQGAEQDLQLKLPRKLMLMQLQEENVDLDTGSNKNYVSQEEESPTGELQYERAAADDIGRKFMRHNQLEEEAHANGDADADASQYLNMDYWHVRKRQPIHNKFVPVGGFVAP